MIKIALRSLLAPGLALALSSCDVFRPDDPQAGANNQAYGAAGPYDANAAGNGYQPYQQPGGNTAAGPYAGTNNAGGAYGGYSAPNYNTPNYNTPNPGNSAPNYNVPYTQPPDTYSTGGSTGGGRTHVVANGENLSKIAQRYGTTTSAIMQANNMANPNYVRVGQKLTIP